MRTLLRGVRWFFESLWLPVLVAGGVAGLLLYGSGHVGWWFRYETAFLWGLFAPPALILVSLVFLCAAKHWWRIAGALVLLPLFAFFSYSLVLSIGVAAMFEDPGPPRSAALPLDGRRDRAVRAFLEAWHERDWDRWEVRIVTYVQQENRRFVAVWYSYDETGFSSSNEYDFLFEDGHLVPGYWHTRDGPVVPTLESPLEWPVQEAVENALRTELGRLLEAYLEALGQELGGECRPVGRIFEIRYSYDRTAEIRYFLGGISSKVTATFSVGGDGVPFLRPELEFDYEDGRFRLWKVRGDTGGRLSEPASFLASLNALDRSVRPWLASASPDAPLGPSPYLETEWPWHERAGDLPGSAGRMILVRRAAHGLFADYDYRLRLELPGRAPKTFVLPFGDNRTSIRVYYAARDGRRHLCLAHCGRTSLSIDLDTLCFATSEPSPQDLVGAFLAVTAPIEYVDVHADRPRARTLFQAAARRGYPDMLGALDAMEQAEAASAARVRPENSVRGLQVE